MSTLVNANDPSGNPSGDSVWLVYDGDCPFCSAAAHIMRIRQNVGVLHIVNAREAAGTPLMAEIAAQRLDLNSGIVVKFGGQLLHGVDALHLLALMGSEQNWMNRLNVALFRQRRIAQFAYPAMKALRNLSLFLLRRPRL